METQLDKMFRGKRTALLGAGVSNMPLARMLCEKGAHVAVCDKKSLEQLGDSGRRLSELGVELYLGDNYLDGLSGRDYIFRSPGFRPDMPELCRARDEGAVVTSEMELFLRLTPATVIGVTGSDGKSTTTTVISKILENETVPGRKIFLGGNIGYPLLDRMESMKPGDICAVELSSFQLMTVDSPVAVAVIKNVTPNHLNWHTDMNEYIQAKARILKGCGTAVLNYDDKVCRSLGENCESPVIWFSRRPIPESFLGKYRGGVYCDGGAIVHYNSIEKAKKTIVEINNILLPGEHNIENYSTAVAATLDYASPEAVRRVAGTFGGVKHRLQLVKELRGVRYYNSSIDSSPTRTAAAIYAVNRPMRIICGGYDKKIPFEPLAKALAENPLIKTVVLTGATMEKIKAALSAEPEFTARNDVQVICESDFEKAVRAASLSAVPGDAVLLSPACASFDAFENFEKRGEAFCQIVETL